MNPSGPKRILPPASGVEKHATIRDCAVFVDIIGQPGCPLWVDIGHVERLLIRREGNAVWRLDVMDQQGHCAIFGQAIDPLNRSFARIVEGMREAKRRIGKIQVAVGLEDQIVRTVDLVPIIVISEWDNRSI